MRYTTLITDFDNTLYDWFEVWSASFLAMLRELEHAAKVPAPTLLRAIRSIHQKHGTSEYAYLLDELDYASIFDDYPRDDLLKKASLAYQRGRSQALHLYPGVKETLRNLRRIGVKTIVYTESLELYTNGRILDLELDGLIDIVYSPPNHALQTSSQVGSFSLLGRERRDLSFTKHRYLPPGVKKPNPEVLQDILEETGADVSTALYVGDSLLKDIAMARDVGVLDVLANYGRVQHKPEYDVLREVSHWSDDDVEKERMQIQFRPTASIDRFQDLLEYFE